MSYNSNDERAADSCVFTVLQCLHFQSLMSSSEQPTSSATGDSRNIQANELKLIGLIDDCLFEIFDYLSLDDLAHILATCKRLNEVAQSVFLRKFQQHPIEISSSCISAWHNGQHITCKQHSRREPNFLNFFHYFGKVITQLSIQFDKQLTASRLKGCLFNNCSETLTKLTMRGIDVNHDFGVLTKKFPNVEELSLYSVDGTDIESLLECFPSVTQLELVNCHKYNRVYSKRMNSTTLKRHPFRPNITKLFPRLQRFKYGDDASHFESELVKSVMRRSPNLRSLSIGVTSYVQPFAIDDLYEITTFSPNLETLEVWNINNFCRDISRSLPRLKKFIVNGPLQIAVQFRTNPKHLEELALGACVIPNHIISDIVSMKTLKKLTLHSSGRVSQGRFKQIMDQDLQKLSDLPNLEELTIKQTSDSIGADSIRRFISSCATLKRLTLVYFMKNKEKKEQFLLNDFGPEWKVFEDFMAVGIERQP